MTFDLRWVTVGSRSRVLALQTKAGWEFRCSLSVWHCGPAASCRHPPPPARERETLWTEENQARLVRIVAGYELNLEQAEVEQRLAQLLAILPGLGVYARSTRAAGMRPRSARSYLCAYCGRCPSTPRRRPVTMPEPKLPYVKPSLLAELLRDPGAVMDKLLALKQLLPRADVGKVAVAQPQVLLEVRGWLVSWWWWCACLGVTECFAQCGKRMTLPGRVPSGTQTLQQPSAVQFGCFAGRWTAARAVPACIGAALTLAAGALGVRRTSPTCKASWTCCASYCR